MRKTLFAFLILLTIFGVVGIIFSHNLSPKMVAASSCPTTREECGGCIPADCPIDEICKKLFPSLPWMCPPKCTPIPTVPVEPTPTPTSPLRETPTPTASPILTPTPTLPPEVTSTPVPTVSPIPSAPIPSAPIPTSVKGPTPTSTPPPAVGGAVVVGGPGGGCGAQTPNTPKLISANKSGSEATLVWDPSSPVTHYSIAYGTSSGNYQYGASNVGNLTSYQVKGLDPAEDYCFVVAAVNDCASSPFSNEICTGPLAGGAVLGIREGEGEVLGLAATNGEQGYQLIFWILGFVCVLKGLELLNSPKKNLKA